MPGLLMLEMRCIVLDESLLMDLQDEQCHELNNKQ